MSAPPIGFFGYVKEAFFWRTPTPGLGHLPLNLGALAVFGVLGIANPGFWLLGGALELAYLTGMASSRRFQRVVQGRRSLARQRQEETKLGAAITRLTLESQRRYHSLLAQCRDIAGISATLDDGAGMTSLRKLRTGGLNQMLWIYLRLLTSREVLVQTLEHTDRESVEREIQGLTERLDATDPETTLARSLTASLDIQQKRLANLDRSTESLHVLEAELVRIESQVALIREEMAVSGKAEALSGRVDSVAEALDETNRWMEQNADIFSGLEGLEEPRLEDLPSTTPPVPRYEGERS